jgi:hypothetical protein
MPPTSQEKFARFIRAETAHWARVIKKVMAEFEERFK